MSATHYRTTRRPEPSPTHGQAETFPDAQPRQPLPPEASILVFPSRAPSESEAPSTPSSRAPELRRGSTTASIPTSLVSSVERRSPRSLSPSGDSWDDVEVDSSSSGGAFLSRSQPLTREHVARIETVQNHWPGAGAAPVLAESPSMDSMLSTDVDAQYWDNWSPTTSSAASHPVSLLQGRRPLSPRVPNRGLGLAASVVSSSTQYEDASSQFHFSTASSDADMSEIELHPSSADDPDFESMFFVTLRSRRPHPHQPPRPTTTTLFHSRTQKALSRDDRHHYDHPEGFAYGASSFFSPKMLPLPFEAILRFFFDLDPTTLNLMKQENDRPHPDNPPGLPPTGLFVTSLSASEEVADVTPTRSTHSLFADEARTALNSIRNGLEAQHSVFSVEEPSLASAASGSDQADSSTLLGIARIPFRLSTLR